MRCLAHPCRAHQLVDHPERYEGLPLFAGRTQNRDVAEVIEKVVDHRRLAHTRRCFDQHQARCRSTDNCQLGLQGLQLRRAADEGVGISRLQHRNSSG
jgi:hypothetical protein